MSQLPTVDDPLTPDLQAAIRTIADCARAIVLRRRDYATNGLRDVHVKHHGLLRAEFVVVPPGPDADAGLAAGIFAKPATYKAWVRFSSSSSVARSDAVADGRGVAIKVLGVGEGPRCLANAPQRDTQDFVLLNGPAFFARNAIDMAIAAKLTADDRFPSLFFLPPSRWRGLLALLEMGRAQAGSPVGLTYHSQTPYRLARAANTPLVVKYRLLPQGDKQSPPSPPGPNYLFEALRERLQGLRQTAATFLFQVQVAGPGDEWDDATRVWKESPQQPFVTVAELRIPPQRFATVPRMKLAERFSFNPYNSLNAHEPLGTINRARLAAYRASAGARAQTNGSLEHPPRYTEAEWVHQRDEEAGAPEFVPPQYPAVRIGEGLLAGLAGLFPALGRGINAFLSSGFAYLVAPALLGLIIFAAVCRPEILIDPFTLPLNKLLPSERLIPPAVATPGADRGDKRWLFRYAPVGTEANGGLPYWIFRALPKMFPDRFGNRLDYSGFGFDTPDDKDFYKDYHGLSRGFILADADYGVAGDQFQLSLKRVCFNCATCHRGEYLTKDGLPQFVDGMPSQRLDTAAYQKAVYDSINDTRFNAKELITAINGLLAAEHLQRPVDQNGKPTLTALTAFEEWFYGQILVPELQATTRTIPIGWKEVRPKNGPGRLDAFGALRYEYLTVEGTRAEGTSDAGTPTASTSRDAGTPTASTDPPGGDPLFIATVDLPSIWHQGPTWRPRHHYDGNTADLNARNYGAVIGVGGVPLSIRRPNVREVADWIDKELAPPPYPFGPVDQARQKQGQAIFMDHCSGCHGTYGYSADGKRQLQPPLPKCMTDQPIDVRTDRSRAQAVDKAFVTKLNAFGASNGVWAPDAFTATNGYLCPPLDGIWARAPYLHNGSVPTLKALLSPAARPSPFYRGSPVYLPDQGGFEYAKKQWAQSATERVELFEFDASKAGNSNEGHHFAVEVLADEAKLDALLAYLYTL